MGPLDVANMDFVTIWDSSNQIGPSNPFFFTCLRKGKRGEEPPPKETKRGPFNNWTWNFHISW